MSLRIYHAYVNPFADAVPDVGQINPTRWNAALVLSGGSVGDLIVYDTGAAGNMGTIAAVTGGQVLASMGSGQIPAWTASPSLSSLTLATALAALSGGTGFSAYTVGDILAAFTTQTLTRIAAAPEGQVLRSAGTGTIPAWGKVRLGGGGGTQEITGYLDPANGGTGLTAYTGGDLLVATAAQVLSRLQDVASGAVLVSKGIGMPPAYETVDIGNMVYGTLPADTCRRCHTTTPGSGSTHNDRQVQLTQMAAYGAFSWGVTSGHNITDKARSRREEPRLRQALLKAQYELLERATFPVVILVNGVDGAGKGETVNLLNEWMDPRHIRTVTFGAIARADGDRPEMWRFWQALPPKGRIGILFGSWYTDPVLRRVKGHEKRAELERLLERIRHFERMLVAEARWS